MQGLRKREEKIKRLLSFWPKEIVVSFTKMGDAQSKNVVRERKKNSVLNVKFEMLIKHLTKDAEQA